METNGDLSGKVIVITGASSGFGRGAALAFAREHANLVVAARREEVIGDVARMCQAQGVRALAVPADVSTEQGVKQVAGEAIAEFGRMDVWINNAGVGALGRFEDIPLDIHEQVICTNLLGTLYGSYFAYQKFVEQGSGTLINIASELGEHTVPYYTSYAASKHGVVGLSQSLQQEIDQNELANVHVCIVMPTAHDTPFFDHVANYTGHRVEAPEPLHDPENVVAALVGLVLDPKNKEIVGGDGIAKVLLKRIAAPVAEKMGAKQMHKTQMEKAPAGSDSPGAVHEPMDQGTTVSAGRRRTRE